MFGCVYLSIYFSVGFITPDVPTATHLAWDPHPHIPMLGEMSAFLKGTMKHLFMTTLKV